MCIPYVLVNLHIGAIAEGYCFTFCVHLIRLLLCLSRPGSLPSQDPCQPKKIPVIPRSQSAQDPSQPKIPVSPGCPHTYLAHTYLAHVYLIFGTCLFDIWLMPTGSTPLKHLLQKWAYNLISKTAKGPFLYYVRVFRGFFEPPTHLRKEIFTT